MKEIEFFLLLSPRELASWSRNFGTPGTLPVGIFTNHEEKAATRHGHKSEKSEKPRSILKTSEPIPSKMSNQNESNVTVHEVEFNSPST